MVKLGIGAVALAAFIIVKPAQGQLYDPSYPVCMQAFGQQEGERMDCIFTSLAQCAASASGRSAMCLTNPYFVRRAGRRAR